MGTTDDLGLRPSAQQTLHGEDKRSISITPDDFPVGLPSHPASIPSAWKFAPQALSLQYPTYHAYDIYVTHTTCKPCKPRKPPAQNYDQMWPGIVVGILA